MFEAQRIALVAAFAAMSAAAAPARAVERGHKPLVAACVTVSIGKVKTEKQCLRPGLGQTETFRDCATCPELVVVPAGRFTMGSPDAEPRRSPSETLVPQTIAKPFAVGRFAVTFDEWDACVVGGGCNGHRPDDGGWGRGMRPVINVNWADANAFAKWISARTGKAYRLLGEREREYVARAGTKTTYWWGNSITLDQANYDLPVRASRDPAERDTLSNGADSAKVRRRTLLVDSFAANPWGLFNVHGNVWEWTKDCWHEADITAARRSLKGQANPASEVSCGQRVSRGGSWNDFAAEARAAARIGFNATSRNSLQGFRIARALP